MKVRLPSAARYVAQVEKEHRWLPHLAPYLPLPIPKPLALGKPGNGYPFPWSVYQWLDGETASQDGIDDLCQFAIDVAGFLQALQRIDPTGGPHAGAHNFFRGGALVVYDEETRRTAAAVSQKIESAAAIAVWEAALAAPWHGPDVWVHGDIAVGNLIVEGGRLSAVIDFGSSAIGDPACDLVIAWTFFNGESRAIFRRSIDADNSMWARARGWALWKALLVLCSDGSPNPAEASARRIIEDVMAENRALS
jgi:aminoglycoside phosphotransferase (APT) family kinase protein